MTGRWEGKGFLFVLLETLVFTKKLNDDSVTIYRHLNKLKYPFSFTEKMKCASYRSSFETFQWFIYSNHKKGKNKTN